MATVPRYDRNQVQAAPLRGGEIDVKAPIEAFGGGAANKAGEQLMSTASTATKLVLQEQELARKMKTEYFTNRIVGDFYLKQHQEGGVYRAKGQDAFGADDRLNKEYDSFLESMSEEATDDDQKNILREVAEKYRIQMRQSLATHVGGEIDKFYEDQKNKTIKNSESVAVLNYRDEAAVEDAYNRVQEATVGYGEYSGRAKAVPVIDPKTGAPSIDVKTGQPITKWEGPAAEEARQVGSNVLRSVLERHLANGDISGARARLQGYDKSGKMTGEDVKAIEAQLDQKDKDYKATISAQAIIDRFNDMGAATEATSKLPPEIRDEVNRKVKIGIQQKNERNTLALESNFAQGIKQISSGGSFTDLHPSIKGAMTYDMQEALKSYEDEIRGVRSVKPDPTAYTSFLAKSDGALAEMQPSEFISKYYLKATPDQRAAMIEMRQAASKGKNGEALAKLQLDMKRQDQQMVLQAMKELGLGGIKDTYTLDTVKKNKELSKQFVSIQDATTKAITREQEIKNRKLSDEEKNVIIKRVASEQAVTVTSFFGDKKIPAEFVTDEMIDSVEVPDNLQNMYIGIARKVGIFEPD